MTTTPDRVGPDPEELERAEEAIEAARHYAERADPLRDGSYAGDASKTSMIDTPDLEAHEHQQADRAREARERLHDAVAADSYADRVDFGAEEDARPVRWSPDGGADAGDGPPRDDLVAREADAEAREARWAAEQGRPDEGGEDNL